MAKVLIIEDDPTIRHAYHVMFERRGHVVATADDVGEALKLTAADSYDVIALDLILPDKSGFDFLEAFDPPKHPGTAVIIMSNLDSVETRIEAERLGARHVLTKAHLSPTDLAEIVETAVRRTED